MPTGFSKVDFRNVVVIMATTNAGASDAAKNAYRLRRRQEG
ncbi:MAG: hypothetical protein R3C13_01375 [Hyphomonas sp.]